MHGIAAIGECMIELSGRGGSLWDMGFAGDAFNTLWTLRALSEDVNDADFVSAFGDDPFSAEQIAFFEKNGIGIAQSPVIADARPGLYAITLTGAERSFTYWRADAAARQLASDSGALAKSLENRALVYFSGITLAILDEAARNVLFAAIEEARGHGARIAFDPNYRARLWGDRSEAKEATRRALEASDIVLPTFEDERQLFSDASPAETALRLERAGIAEIVVKNGDGPAFVAHYGDHTRSPAMQIATPLDTTGAGDSFNGAYLAARLLGHSPVESTVRAHRVAATVIQVRGALAPMELIRMAFGA